MNEQVDIWADRRVRIGYETAEELARCYNRDNWRAHPENQRAATEDSLDTLGLIGQIKKSTVNNLMFDGHLRVELALAKNPQMLLPVDYYDLSDDETALALTIHDAITEQAEPIPDKLAALLARARTLEMTADRPGLGEMLERLKLKAGINGHQPKEDAGPQIDKAAELQKVWGVKVGDVWELGQHRLVCGDCTDRATVEAVMRGERARFEFSDPPYEMTTEGGGILKTAPRLKEIAKKGLDSFTPSILELLTPTALFCCNKPLVPDYIELAKTVKVSWDLCFFTREDTAPNFGGHLMSDTEYLFILGKQAPNYGMEKAIYSKSYIDKSGRDSLVAWAKPVGLVEKFLRLYSLPGDSVLDRFVGSGTTIIAAENLGRKCRAIELDPGYTAVSLQRFVDAGGQTPRRVSG